jgi:hypothetical protein
MILGEGAAVCCLKLKERKIGIYRRIGYATEVLDTIYLFLQKQLVFKIDENGLENTKLSDIDVIVMHAPGTIKGDLTEYKAIQKLFMKAYPY